ncbi:hypothetical protein BH23PLA1_BH23PLA1_41810 [soil metagenome]
MTPRPLARTRRNAARMVLALGLLGLAGGCDPRSLVYFLQPFEQTIKPPCPSLKGKKVVILTYAAAGPRTEIQSIDQDLASGLARILRQEVKRIEIVPQDKVQIWADAHPHYTSPSEAGLAFDADIVIFLEIEQYSTRDRLSPGMLSGSSRVHVQVHELKLPTDDRGKPIEGQPRVSEVIHDDFVETIFPRVQGSFPIDSSINPTSFGKKFFDLVVTEVSWHFVNHAPGDNIQDTNF